MKVPPHILLPTDVEQAAQSSAIEVNLLSTEIETLQVQLKNVSNMFRAVSMLSDKKELDISVQVNIVSVRVWKILWGVQKVSLD